MTDGFLVSAAKFAGRTGRGVRIAVVDSGIHASHPHVGGISDGIAIDDDGQARLGVEDRLGHGTAVAGAIREKAPDAVLIPVKVFDRSLRTTARALAAAIRWAADERVAIINLSLGTATPDHAPVLEAVLRDAAAQGAIVVSAAPQHGRAWLPGALTGVLAVQADWTCPRDACEVHPQHDGGALIRASAHPRPIPGIPPDLNFSGPSFAVANATGLIALAIEGREVRSVEDVVRWLGQT
ncbi:MAG TPA: S8 family serine peptidase [Vicinamibacterales bacterium]|nr:S8 family serine peptidase [Vicinamibacterales bacterium]